VGGAEPTSEEEIQILRDVRRTIANLKTKPITAYILQRMTGRNVPGAYNKPELIKIATTVK
jgi:hypothetical protein